MDEELEELDDDQIYDDFPEAGEEVEVEDILLLWTRQGLCKMQECVECYG